MHSRGANAAPQHDRWERTSPLVLRLRAELNKMLEDNIMRVDYWELDRKAMTLIAFESRGMV